MDTPVPIPNTEVKHFNADGSKFNLARVGRCQALSLIYIYSFVGFVKICLTNPLLFYKMILRI